MGETAEAARTSRKGTEDANSADRMDEIFSLLSNQRRRYALYACDSSDGPLSVSDLAEKVAAREYDKGREKLDYDERKRVYTAMTQTHLPAMEEAGVVEYDGREVSLTDKAEEIEVYMDVVPRGSLPWSYYYLGLSVISALVLGGVWAGIYPESVPDLFWAGLVIALFGVSSAYHAYRSRGMRLSSVEEPCQAWEDA
jgi:hypothetical protein